MTPSTLLLIFAHWIPCGTVYNSRTYNSTNFGNAINEILTKEFGFASFISILSESSSSQHPSHYNETVSRSQRFCGELLVYDDVEQNDSVDRKMANSVKRFSCDDGLRDHLFICSKQSLILCENISNPCETTSYHDNESSDIYHLIIDRRDWTVTVRLLQVDTTSAWFLAPLQMTEGGGMLLGYQTTQNISHAFMQSQYIRDMEYLPSSSSSMLEQFVTLDIAMLQAAPKTDDHKFTPSQLCHSLQKSFRSLDSRDHLVNRIEDESESEVVLESIPFSINVGLSSYMNSLRDYLYDYCGVNPPTLYIWESIELSTKYRTHMERPASLCNLQSIKYLPAHLDNVVKQQHSSSLVCIEDVLDYFTLFQSNKEEVDYHQCLRLSSKNNHLFSDVVSLMIHPRNCLFMPLTYVHMGDIFHRFLLPNLFALNKSSNADMRSEILLSLGKEFTALSSIMRAFGNSNHKQLHIRSPATALLLHQQQPTKTHSLSFDSEIIQSIGRVCNQSNDIIGNQNNLISHICRHSVWINSHNDSSSIHLGNGNSQVIDSHTNNHSQQSSYIRDLDDLVNAYDSKDFEYQLNKLQTFLLRKIVPLLQIEQNEFVAKSQRNLSTIASNNISGWSNTLAVTIIDTAVDFYRDFVHDKIFNVKEGLVICHNISLESSLLCQLSPEQYDALVQLSNTFIESMVISIHGVLQTYYPELEILLARNKNWESLLRYLEGMSNSFYNIEIVDTSRLNLSSMGLSQLLLQTTEFDRNVEEILPSARGLESAAQTESNGMEEMKSSSDRRTKDIKISTNGDGFVFIFLLPSQVAFAQKMLQVWRNHCEHNMCQVYLTYMIFEVVPDLLSFHGSILNASVSDRRCLLHRYHLNRSTDLDPDSCDCVSGRYRPSIRTSYRIARQMLDMYSSSHDVVTILIGIEALLAFPYPSTSGMYQSVGYGQSVSFNIIGNVMIARSFDEGDGGNATVNNFSCFGGHRENEWQFRSIAGVAYIVNDFLSTVESSPFYPNMKSDEDLECFLLDFVNQDKFVWTFDVVLDERFEIFDYRRRKMLLPVEGIIGNHYHTHGIANLEMCHLSIQDSVHQIKEDEIFSPEQMVNVVDKIDKIMIGICTVPLNESLFLDEFNEMLVTINLNAANNSYTSIVHASLLSVSLLSSVRRCYSEHVYSVIEFYLHNIVRHFFDIGRSARRSEHLAQLTERLMSYEFISKIYERLIDMDSDGSNPFAVNKSTRDYEIPRLKERLNLFRESAYLTPIAVAVEVVQISLMNIIGPFSKTTSHIYKSVLPSTYHNLNRRRSLWLSQRSSMTAENIKVHYLTMSSEESDALTTLLLTAEIAGIDLQVIGLNQPYTDYFSKIERYADYILYDSLTTVSDDDVLVLLDAFDVLLFPAIRNIGNHVANSHTPIVFCAENGIYPEIAGPVIYPRGYNHDRWNGTRGAGKQSFLNSGCIAGRAGQVRSMFKYVMDIGREVRDDQQIFIRYMAEHPDIVSIDVDRKMFYTGYRELLLGTNELYLTIDLNVVVQSHGVVLENIGVIHCNNMGSYATYPYLAKCIQVVYHNFYSGRDGKLLLEANQLIQDKDFEAAIQVLSHPLVQQNITSTGGSNNAGEFLWRRAHQGLRKLPPKTTSWTANEAFMNSVHRIIRLY